MRQNCAACGNLSNRGLTPAKLSDFQVPALGPGFFACLFTLSAPKHNYGDVLAEIFFTAEARRAQRERLFFLPLRDPD